MARNDKFSGVTTLAELQAQRDKAFAAFETARDAAVKAGPTDSAAVSAATEAADAVDEYDAELAERKAEQKKADDAFAALQGRTFASEEEKEEEALPDAEANAEESATEEEAEEVAEPEAEAEVAAAVEEAEPAAPVKAAAKGGRVAQLAKSTKRPAAPAVDDSANTTMSIVAGAGSGFESGETITFEQLGESIFEKIGSFSVPDESRFDHGDQAKAKITEHPIAKLSIAFPEELTITGRMGEEEIAAILEHAADESRLEGESLVAAGGWCAPSEVLYDLSEDESLDGILSLPEVAVKRGGFRHTPGPQFSDFYASPGFKQTESQAIAGTTKTAVEVSCPTFTDERLDVLGLWIKVPILTEVGYPELVKRFSSGTMTAHEHWKNLDLINRVLALSTSRDLAGTGLSSVSDALEALDLVAQQRRQSQRLKFDRTMEVLLPFWMKSVYMNDIARRAGRGTPSPVDDAELNAWFAAYKLNVQWLYDWQVLPSTATDVAYPATYTAVIYPAGTFVKGTSAVIKLGAIYDSGLLATNEYTGSFTEEGVLVAKMKLGSDKLVNMPTCSKGRMGALNLTCP